mgnify:CR=1 FL=1
MTEMRLEDTLQAIHDERLDLPDAPTVSAQILSIPLQDVPQERRWLPGWLGGTSRTLFGSVKLAAAAVVVALFGAVLLLGVLSTTDDEPAATPTPAPTESAEPESSEIFAPAPVTGQGDFGSSGSNWRSPVQQKHGSRSWEDGVTRYDDAWYTLGWEADDPRLTGEATIRHNAHDYESLGLLLSSGVVELATADGRWTGEVDSLLAGDLAKTTILLSGEGAYEGLTAYVMMDENDDEPPTFSAAVFPGEMPEHVAKVAASPAPFEEGGDVDMGPAVVTGTASHPLKWGGGSRGWDGSRVVGTDQYEVYEFEASDPRLSGELSSTFDFIFYENLGVYVADGDSTLETADGRWSGDFSFVGGESLANVATVTLHGEGAYEGLSAWLVMDQDAGRKFAAGIVNGDLPTPPDPN